MAQAATLEEQLNWQKWIKSRDTDSGDYLIKKYLPLVSYHVQRISVSLPKSVSREELRSFGLLGLYDALEKFDQSRDLKFDTYASFRIRGAILDGLRKEDWLPRNTRDKSKKIDAAIEKLEQQKLGKVSVSDIAQELNMTEDDVYTTMNEQFFANILSMDEQPLDSDDKDNHFFTIKDKKALIPEEVIVKQELIDELAVTIEELSAKEQVIISLFYQEELTLTEIGKILNLSTSRISQIHSKALFKLRHSLEKVIL
jgi:RNA polymerase sigma factor for flagellar operon FliA